MFAAEKYPIKKGINILSLGCICIKLECSCIHGLYIYPHEHRHSRSHQLFPMICSLPLSMYTSSPSPPFPIYSSNLALRLFFPHSNQGKLKNVSNNSGKFGVPNPVTGSHPLALSNPAVPHPWLPPFVTSLRA